MAPFSVIADSSVKFIYGPIFNVATVNKSINKTKIVTTFTAFGYS
jgi:hypothetical protein